jgi:hypothetical protein
LDSIRVIAIIARLHGQQSVTLEGGSAWIGNRPENQVDCLGLKQAVANRLGSPSESNGDISDGETCTGCHHPPA